MNNNGGKPKHVVYLIYTFNIEYILYISLRYSFVHSYYGIQSPGGNFAAFEYKMIINMIFYLISVYTFSVLLVTCSFTLLQTLNVVKFDTGLNFPAVR